MLNSTIIMEAPYLARYEAVARTWRERLLGLPWRPRQKYKSVEIESSEIIFDQRTNVVFASPLMAARLRAEFDRHRLGGGE